MHYLDAFERTVRVHGDDTAIRTTDGRRFTYAEFDRRSTQLTNAVEDRVGAAPLAVLTKNCPAATEAMIAGPKRGSPTVHLPYRVGHDELIDMVDAVGPEAIVFDDANVEGGVAVLEETAVSVGFHAGDEDVDAPGVASYEGALDAAAAERPTDLPREGDSNVYFTSGTTSRPKAVAFEAEQMWVGAYQVVMEHGIDKTDLGIVTTPWYHMVTADAWLYPHWLAGASVLLQPDFDPEAVLDLIETHEATGLLAVPTQLSVLNEVQEEGPRRETDSLDYIRTGGAVVTEELVERTSTYLAECLYNTYGLTEGGPNLTFAHPTDQDDHPGTIGKESFSWELRVVEAVDLDDHPDPSAVVEPGEEGEVIARGPGVPDGYVDNPTAEARSFFDEWLRTRDVARFDDDGFLYITDRIDNMFTSGGENIYPREVERVLESQPGVSDTLVFGLPDEQWGNKVAAIVVSDGAVTADDLDERCRQHGSLADYKRPREYVFQTDPLPRTDTGTVEREQAIARHFG